MTKDPERELGVFFMHILTVHRNQPGGIP